MVKRQGGVLRQINRLYSLGAVGGVTDAQLLARFLARRDAGAEAAFEVLVERHGPMVLRVCRAALHDEHAAEDAFQATFLVLARKARSLWLKDSLGSWLHAVARRVASRARSDTVRRRWHERQSAAQVAAKARTEATPDDFHCDEAEVLRDEIDRLPDKYHAPIVLCYLESLSYEDAASRLGLSEDALRGRLARARERLRSRLTRRGLHASAVLAATRPGMQAPVVMPFGLFQSAVWTALRVEACEGLDGGLISRTAISLCNRTCGTMIRTRLTTAALTLLLGTLVAGGVALFSGGGQSSHRVRPAPPRIVVTSPKIQDITIAQRYACQIRSRRHIQMQALANGYLEEIRVKEGQTVKKGDLMFKIAPTIHKAKLAADLTRAERAQREFNQRKQIAHDQEAFKNEERLLQAKLAEAKANLEDAESSFRSIKAPFDGLVGTVREQQGGLIKEGDSLTTLSDNSVLWVYFNVPENAYLKYMASPKLSRDSWQIDLELANNQKFPRSGKIGAIMSSFNNQTGNIPFRADFQNPDRLLRHGQTGTVLVHRVLKNAIVIPQRATFEKLDKRYVYLVDKNGVAHERAITIQNELDDVFVVEAGVGADDKIVVEGGGLVRAGDKVEYQERQTR